jgi:hypothetical protein
MDYRKLMPVFNIDWKASICDSTCMPLKQFATSFASTGMLYLREDNSYWGVVELSDDDPIYSNCGIDEKTGIQGIIEAYGKSPLVSMNTLMGHCYKNGNTTITVKGIIPTVLDLNKKAIEVKYHGRKDIRRDIFLITKVEFIIPSETLWEWRRNLGCYQ